MRFFVPITVKGDDPDRWRRQWDDYQSYLASVADRLPASAREFAAARWHYDHDDHRCPHDAWVESACIVEPVLAVERSAGPSSSPRALEIRVRLLGAYHDGHLELTYRGVRGYTLGAPAQAGWLPGRERWIGHGDWLTDEIRLSDAGHVEHEIEFERGTWLIECADIKWQWSPTA